MSYRIVRFELSSSTSFLEVSVNQGRLARVRSVAADGGVSTCAATAPGWGVTIFAGTE